MTSQIFAGGWIIACYLGKNKKNIISSSSAELAWQQKPLCLVDPARELDRFHFFLKSSCKQKKNNIKV